MPSTVSISFAVSVLVISGCSSMQTSHTVRAEGGGEIITPAGFDSSQLTITPSTQPITDTAIRSVGPAYDCGPAGTPFAKPVTVRLPIDAIQLAAYHGRPEEVRVYTRSKGDAHFSALETTLDATKQFVEAKTTHFSTFVAALPGGQACLSGPDVDHDGCADKICQLPEFIANQTFAPPPDMGISIEDTLITKAQDACTKAQTGDFSGAKAAAAELVQLVMDAVQAGTLDGDTANAIIAFINNATPFLNAPTVDVTGTWFGPLPFNKPDGTIYLRPVAVQLHQRRDGTLLGYVLGGTEFRTVVGGAVMDNHMQLIVEWADPKKIDTFSLLGSVGGNSFSANVTDSSSANDGAPSTSVTFTRVTTPYEERRVYFTDDPSPTSGNDPNVLEISLLTNNGTFSVGSFSSTIDCSLFACSGGVTSFSEKDDGSGTIKLVLGLESKGDCAGAATIHGTWDPTMNVYKDTTIDYAKSGTQSNCVVSVSGKPLTLGVRGIRTTSADVAKVLGSFARVADDLQARANFLNYLTNPPYPPVSSMYLHYGQNHDALVSSFWTLSQAWPSLTVTFNRFRNLSTVADSTIFPAYEEYLNTVSFHDYRVGYIGGASQVFLDTDQTPEGSPYSDLVYLHAESGNIVFYGNQESTLDFTDILEKLPFAFDEMSPKPVNLWPYGIHGGGDPTGHTGIDFNFDKTLHVDVISPVAGSLTTFFDSDDDSVGIIIQKNQIFKIRIEGIVDFSLTPPVDVSAGEILGIPVIHGMSTPYSSFHLGIGADLVNDICPYWAMSSEAQGQMIEVAQKIKQAQQLVEPFLCNSRVRECPMETIWTRTTMNNPNNPESIQLTRECTGTMNGFNTYSDTIGYEFTAGGPPRSGTVTVGPYSDPPTVDFDDQHGIYKLTFTGPTTTLMQLNLGTPDGGVPTDLDGGDTYTAAEETSPTMP